MQRVKIKLQKLPEDIILLLDPFRTHQVVINILSNALKFSKVNDVIVVKLKVTNLEQPDDVLLQINVTDNGCGISKAE
jgi:signal transduction histidine kinase